MQSMTETWAAADGTVIAIRPISPADLALEQEFVHGLSASTGYQRLMSARSPSPEELRRFTDIDQEREFALIATTLVQGQERQIGVARYVKESSPGDAEFAIVLSDDWQGRGLGIKLSAVCLLPRRTMACDGWSARRCRGTEECWRWVASWGSLARDASSATITNLTMDVAAWSPAGAAAPHRQT
jgi:hypothetical protein